LKPTARASLVSDIIPIFSKSDEIPKSHNGYFGDQPPFAVESIEYLLDMVAFIGGLEKSNLNERYLVGILDFFQSLTWASVYSLVGNSTNEESKAARQQSLQLISLLSAAFPMLNYDVNGLSAAKLFSTKSAVFCLSLFLKLIQREAKGES
jgi:hypothetical protein